MQHLHVERFLQKAGEVGRAECRGRLQLAVAAGQDHGHVRTDLADSLERLFAARSRYFQIERDGGDLAGYFSKKIDRFDTVRRSEDREVPLRQPSSQESTDQFVVGGDENDPGDGPGTGPFGPTGQNA